MKPFDHQRRNQIYSSFRQVTILLSAVMTSVNLWHFLITREEIRFRQVTILLPAVMTSVNLWNILFTREEIRFRQVTISQSAMMTSANLWNVLITSEEIRFGQVTWVHAWCMCAYNCFSTVTHMQCPPRRKQQQGDFKSHCTYKMHQEIKGTWYSEFQTEPVQMNSKHSTCKSPGSPFFLFMFFVCLSIHFVIIQS